jgi:hypothetical protein
MANASLSPRQLAVLLARLDEAQRSVMDVRAQLIQAMAARRRAGEPPRVAGPARKKRR